MKTKFFISFVICTFLFFILAEAVLASGNIVAKIITDKATYQTGEDIQITVQLGPQVGSASPVFWTTNLYIVASNQGDALSFNDGAVLSVTDPIYSSLDKNEKSTSHINTGIYYGWWVKKSVSNSAITLTGFRNLASFTAKALAVSQATSVELGLDTSKSFIQDWDAELNPIPLIINVEKASITINPPGGGSAVCGDSDDVCTPAGSSQSCTVAGSYQGTKTCKSDCSEFGVCTTTEFCGDGIKNGAEVCDGSGLDGKTCATQGFTGGTLACSSTCTFNTAGCTSTTPPTCTDGIKNQDETDVDCGGVCAVKCATGKSCSSAVDCVSSHCLTDVCVGCISDADCTVPTFEKCDITNHICIHPPRETVQIAPITLEEYDLLQKVEEGFSSSSPSSTSFTVSELVTVASKLKTYLLSTSITTDQGYPLTGKDTQLKNLLNNIHGALNSGSTILQKVSLIAYRLINQ